jgi:hypothetical protein
VLDDQRPHLRLDRAHDQRLDLPEHRQERAILWVLVGLSVVVLVLVGVLLALGPVR